MYFFLLVAADEKTLLVLLHRSSEGQTTTLQDGELTRHRVIKLFFVDVDFFFLSWPLLRSSDIRLPIVRTSNERQLTADGQAE